MIFEDVKIEFDPEVPILIVTAWSDADVHVAPEHTPLGYEYTIASVRESFGDLFRGLGVWGELKLTIAQNIDSCTLVARLRSCIEADVELARIYIHDILAKAEALWAKLCRGKAVQRFVFSFSRAA